MCRHGHLCRMAGSVSNTPTSSPTRTVFLRPLGGAWPDGTQQFAVVDQDVPVWVSTTVYSLGTQVTGSDGHVYVSKVSGLKGVNPVGDSAVHWQGLW